MSLFRIALYGVFVLGASMALARGPFVPPRGHTGYSGGFQHHQFQEYPVFTTPYPNSAPLVGSWERRSSALSFVGPATPPAEWTPMFSSPLPKTTVQGVPLSSLRGSAKGSYIYVAPGVRGKEFSTMIEGLPPEGTIEWSKK